MREKAEKPAKRRLTRAERKQIEAVIRQAKGDGKAHTVQDSIPFQNMFPDGLCRLEGGTLSKTIAFEDVNYRLAGPEDQRSIFESLCDFYNGYDPSIGVQVSLDSRSGGSAADEMFGITRQGNDLDPIRDEAVDILRMQYKRGNNGYVKTKYVTLTIEAENLPAARARFARIEADTLNRFKVLGAAAHVLDGKERLELLYNILHPEGGQFAFEWDWLPASGLSVKDFISPSSFHFGETRTFRIGRRYGAVSFLQILVLGAMFLCFRYENIEMAVFWFCIFSVQATILSPAKKGVVKDMVGSRQLGYASGLMEMSLILSMLAAQIGIFVWFDILQVSSNDGWEAAAFPTMILTFIAIPVAVAALFLPRYPSKQTRKFEWKLFYEHFVQLKYLWSQRDLRLSEIGISYFWFLAGALMLISLQIAQEHPIGDAGFSMSAAILMAWLSGGTVVGGVIASVICRKKIELGLIPLGAIGFTVGCIAMSFFAPGSLASNIGFGITGAFAAAYLVPLNAHLQDNCDPSNRSTVIAAGNLMDCIMGLVAVGFQLMLRNIFSVQNQFWVLAVLGVVITIVAFRLIPREFIRMMGLWIMRIVYRSRIIHQDRIPEDGGAIIVANHVTNGSALFH